MKRLFVAALTLTSTVQAFADRYGVAESMGESGPLSPDLLMLALGALTIYHFWKFTTLERKASSVQFRLELETAEQRDAKEKAEEKYAALKVVLERWRAGLIDNSELDAALRPFLDQPKYRFNPVAAAEVLAEIRARKDRLT